MGYNEKNNKKNTLISVTVTSALLVIIIILIVLLIQKQLNKQDPRSSTPPNSAAVTTPPVMTPTAVPPTAVPPTAATSSPEVSPTGTSGSVVEPTLSPEYDYSKPVPESNAVGLESFNDAIFIGDSRMEDFANFSGIAKYATFYTHIGMTVNHLITDDLSKIIRFKVNGENLTLEEALRKYNSFTKVYIMLGYNELGWPDVAQFIKYYVKVFDLIKTVNPKAEIYVECIIPVARQITGYGVDPQTENNENIAVFNRAIQEMCEAQKVYYLNVQEALVDSEGYLPDGAASDGIHMKKDYCIKWLEYIRSHIV